MHQPEFHQAYLAMLSDYKAELIGGVVYEPSPLGLEHGTHDAHLICFHPLCRSHWWNWNGHECHRDLKQ